MKLPRALQIALWPLSLGYGLAARLRAWLYTHGWLKQKRLNGTVISVGNITVGGTGKTPMVIWLAEKYLAEGKRVAILTRGYGGADGSSDEIELMKERLRGRALFGVGKNRYDAGQRLEAEGVDIFLLDDGFQHLQLARDVDLVLIDRLQALSTEKLLPAGRLREPSSALNRADFVIYTRMDGAKQTIRLIQQLRKFPIFPASTVLLGFRRPKSTQPLLSTRELAPGPYFAFCGVGNPEGFFLDLERWGLSVSGRRAFRDHHKYTVAEVNQLESAAVASGASALVTTEKDWHNLAGTEFKELPVYICVITLQLADQKQFFAAMDAKLRSRPGAAA
jgi:tetraacyldisaccharide 4'-kinase